MPLYDFHCEHCEHDFTSRISMSERDEADVPCPECGKSAKRVFVAHVVETRFRGQGWTRLRKPDPNTGRYF